jgi:hypothetical protein
MCGHDNRIRAKFCEEYAAQLARGCASCGTQLSPTAKFCPECAYPASAEARQALHRSTYTPKYLAEKILTSKVALEGERKEVTVLFDYLEGSMELFADHDPAGKLLGPVLDHMLEAVHRYETTVSRLGCVQTCTFCILPCSDGLDAPRVE